MDNPGQFPLIFSGVGDFAIAGAATYTGDWLTGLDGMTSMSVMLDFRPSTPPGLTVLAYIQTSLDGGNTAIDIACVQFTTLTQRRVINITATQAATPFVPSDGGLAADSMVNGVLGDMVRLKLITTGTYTNTVLAGRIIAR